jgi:hypothetical protein
MSVAPPQSGHSLVARVCDKKTLPHFSHNNLLTGRAVTGFVADNPIAGFLTGAVSTASSSQASKPISSMRAIASPPSPLTLIPRPVNCSCSVLAETGVGDGSAGVGEADIRISFSVLGIKAPVGSALQAGVKTVVA